jgi:hypothetical protein
MADLFYEFVSWRAAPDRAALVREQVSRFTPHDLRPPLHRGSPAIDRLSPTECKEMAEWYRALAKISPSREHAERYKGFAKALLDSKPGTN